MTQTRLRYARLAEVVRLIERFEDCTLPRDAWNHGAHLTVALWYMLHYDEAEATSKMIGGIRAYNHVQGIRQTRTGGYHETITLFWLALTARFLERAPYVGSEVDLFNLFLDTHSDPGLLRQYYSPELIKSRRARQCWVEPDRRPLGG